MKETIIGDVLTFEEHPEYKGEYVAKWRGYTVATAAVKDNGNGSFIMLTEESDYITVEDIMRLFGLRLLDREDYKDIRIEYKVGIAETFKENQTARKLLSEAIKSKKEYVSHPLKNEAFSE